MKLVFNKSNGFAEFAQENPKRPGEFIFPGNTIEIPPPAFDPRTQTCVFVGNQWMVSEIPIPEPEPEPEPPPPEPDYSSDPIPADIQMRETRNSRLAETDYLALTDRTLSTEMAAYRQALRDLPAIATPDLDEDGNLIGVTWPVKPE